MPFSVPTPYYLKTIMKVVRIKKNARLQRDADGHFWLIVESSKGPAMFNLSAIETNPITKETTNIGFNDVLEAFTNDQENPEIESVN